MSKTNKALTVLVVLLAVALGVVLYWQKVGSREVYSAVYLSTGDIYFGKLSRFPRTELHDVWFLQKGGNEQGGVTLAKFGDALWGPQDWMIVNDEQILWVTELKNDSEVVQTIKNPQWATAVQTGMIAPQQVAPAAEEPITKEIIQEPATNR